MRDSASSNLKAPTTFGPRQIAQGSKMTESWPCTLSLRLESAAFQDRASSTTPLTGGYDSGSPSQRNQRRFTEQSRDWKNSPPDTRSRTRIVAFHVGWL